MQIGRTQAVIEAAPLHESLEERADVRREVAARDPGAGSRLTAEAEKPTRVLEVTA